MDATESKRQAHSLIDQLPAGQVSAAVSLLEFLLLGPMERKLALAPMDDEPETEAERQAAARAVEALGRNSGVPMETVLSDFGLTLEDFRRLGREEEPGTSRA